MGTADLMPPLVYVDTNLFISALEGPGAIADHAWWILEAIDEGEIRAMTSELTLAEVLVHPLRRGDTALVETYRAMISPSKVFSVVPVDRSVLFEAARLRAEHTALRLPDAIHLATALAVGADHLVTRDARLATISRIPVVDGGPHSLEAIRKVTP